MTQPQIVTIPFGAWSPDSPDHGNSGTLKRLEGVISNGGVRRTIRRATKAGASSALATSYTSARVLGMMGTMLTDKVSTSPSGTAQAFLWTGTRFGVHQHVVDKAFGIFGAPTDISNASGYGGVPARPVRPWMFTTFGERMICTNWTDPIQYIQPNAATPGTLADLITGTDKPLAAHVAAFGPHLLIGDIFTLAATDLGAAGDYSDYIWVSTAENAADFNGTGNSWQPLLDVPGAVMGIVGGDTLALVFKATGIYLLSLTGGAEIFSARALTNTVGTIFPQSITKHGGDVYFWATQGGIYRIRDYGPPERISNDDVDFFLTDEDNPQAAKWVPGQLPIGDPSSVDLEVPVWGATDNKTGTVMWLYKTRDSVAASPVGYLLLLYNVWRGEWSLIQPEETSGNTPYAMTSSGHPFMETNDEFSPSVVVYESPNSITQEPAVFRHATDSYLVIAETEILAPSAFSEGEPSVQSVLVKRVQPVFSGSGTHPPVTIVINYGRLPDLSDKTTITIDDTYKVEQWYQVPSEVAGVYFQMTITIGSITNNALQSYRMRALWGIRADIVPVGY